MKLERTNGEAVVRGQQDRHGALRRGKYRQKFQPAHAWHLHVDKSQIRRETHDAFECRTTVFELADDLDIGLSGQPHRYAVPGQRFVVDDDDAHQAVASR